MAPASSRAGGFAPAGTESLPDLRPAQATATQAPPTTIPDVRSTRQTPTGPQKADIASASTPETTGSTVAAAPRRAGAAASLAATKAARSAARRPAARPTEAEREVRTAAPSPSQTAPA